MLKHQPQSERPLCGINYVTLRRSTNLEQVSHICSLNTDIASIWAHWSQVIVFSIKLSKIHLIESVKILTLHYPMLIQQASITSTNSEIPRLLWLCFVPQSERYFDEAAFHDNLNVSWRWTCTHLFGQNVVTRLFRILLDGCFPIVLLLKQRSSVGTFVSEILHRDFYMYHDIERLYCTSCFFP